MHLEDPQIKLHGRPMENNKVNPWIYTLNLVNISIYIEKNRKIGQNQANRRQFFHN
jgi:hypothetical protein